MTALTIIPGLDIATLYQNTRKCGDTKSCCVLRYGASVSYDYLSWPPAVNVLFVQYFGLQPNACKGNDISLSLTSPLHGSNAPRGCFFFFFFFNLRQTVKLSLYAGFSLNIIIHVRTQQSYGRASSDGYRLILHYLCFLMWLKRIISHIWKKPR